jgi:hypothetical protein
LLAGVAAPKSKADAIPAIKYFAVLSFACIDFNYASSEFLAEQGKYGFSSRKILPAGIVD